MFLLPVAFLSSLFMAWTVGADSVSPSFGPVVSSRAVGILRSALIVGISGLLGAFLQGEGVTETLSSGFVDGISFDLPQAASILLVSGGLVAIGVWLHYPVPTAYTLVGATMGAGLSMGGSLDLSQVVLVFSCWLVLPFIAAGIGYFTSRLLRALIPKNSHSKRIIQRLLLLVGIYTAFTAGANHVGLAVGPLVDSTPLNMRWLLVLGGSGILLGAWTGAPKIISTVAMDYADIGPRRAVAALLGTSLLTQTASLIGIPISLNAAILGAIIGSGLVEGGKNIGIGKIRRTVASWGLTFLASFATLFLIQQIL